MEQIPTASQEGIDHLRSKQSQPGAVKPSGQQVYDDAAHPAVAKRQAETENEGAGLKDKKHLDPDELDQKENEDGDAENTPPEEQINYTASDEKKGEKRSFLKRRGLLVSLGAGGISLIIVLAAILGFLNVFKLDTLLQNIDARTFARLNGNLDGRSNEYIRTYMIMRLADIGDSPNLDRPNDPDNLILRANNVDTGNPVYKWYRVLRGSNTKTSAFERQVFEKHGIKFASVARREGNQIIFRPAVVTFDTRFKTARAVLGPDQLGLTPAQRQGVADIDVNQMNGRLREFVNASVFNDDKAARKQIKQIVHDETRFYKVFERRMLRKSIQNMTGVRDWRFFEKTRSNLEERRTNIRNKILDKALPESTKNGKLVRCLFGLSDCKKSDDPSDPQHRADTTTVVGDNGTNDQSITTSRTTDNPDGTQTTTTGTETYKTAEFLSEILKRTGVAFSVVNIAATVDLIEKIDSNIRSGAIAKTVQVAKATQAVGLYQVMKTSRDQIIKGDVTPEEFDAFMQVLGNASNSEAWAVAVAGSSPVRSAEASEPGKVYAAGPSNLGRTAYCEPDHQAKLSNPENEKEIIENDKQYHYLCPDAVIGSANRAEQLEDAYLSTIGKITGPIAEAVRAARDSFFGKIFDGILKIAEVFGGAVNFVVEKFIAVLGLDDDLARLMSIIANKIAAFLGAGPILSGLEPGGVFMNYIVQGAAYTAESTSRMLGAAVTTATSANHAQQLLAGAEADRSLSFNERYFSLNQYDSLASRTLFSTADGINDTPDVFSVVGSSLSNIKNVLPGMLFNRVGAQPVTNDSYAGAKVAAIDSYDWPPECDQLKPITSQPKQGSNIQAVLGVARVPDTELTWELMTNSNDWYDYVYEKVGAAVGDPDQEDTTAKTIHNCWLRDNAVRGGIGTRFGYTDDDGYSDNSQPAADTAEESTGDVSLTSLNGYTLNPNEVRWVKYIKDDVMARLPGSANEQAAMAARVTWWSLKEGILNGNIIPGGNPHRNSNCGSQGQKSNILELCSAGLWQIGMAGVQFANFNLAQVEAVARQRNPDKTIQEILADVAVLVGHNQGSSEYNTIINATGPLRKSLLMRDPATGFTLVDRNVTPECLSGTFAPFCDGYDSTNNIAASPAVALKVVNDELTPYFKGSVGLSSLPGATQVAGTNYYRMPEAPGGEYVFSPNTPPTERCGSKELVNAIYTVSKAWNQKYPSNKLIVGDLNAAAGHASHENGVDVDITTQGQIAANTAGSVQASKDLGRMFADTGIIKYIFYNDPAVQSDFNTYVRSKGLPGVMQYEDNHHHHFHVRIADQYRLTTVADCPQ